MPVGSGSGSGSGFKNSDLRDPEPDPAENGPDLQPCLFDRIRILNINKANHFSYHSDFLRYFSKLIFCLQIFSEKCVKKFNFALELAGLDPNSNLDP